MRGEISVEISMNERIFDQNGHLFNILKRYKRGK